jgi:hypothetical protein
VIYDDHAYCYGGCGRILLSELGIEGEAHEPIRRDPPEDLGVSLSRIATLPKIWHRGLEFPADDRYFYIVWSNGSFYKRRLLVGSDGAKYLCPRGVTKPLFVAREQTGQTKLVIVEGELNALSLASVPGNYDIVSPGGCGDFKTERYLSYYLTGYDKYVILVDADSAGLSAAIELKNKLIKHSPYISVMFCKHGEDCNDLLIQGKIQNVSSKVQEKFT